MFEQHYREVIENNHTVNTLSETIQLLYRYKHHSPTFVPRLTTPWVSLSPLPKQNSQKSIQNRPKFMDDPKNFRKKFFWLKRFQMVQFEKLSC